MKKAVDIRPSAVAGMFYPDDAAELRNMVHTFLQDAKQYGKTPKAIIAPHAGYVYSGPIAATAYAQLAAARDLVRRVVLLGPSHRVPFRGIAMSSAKYFATPLGNVPIDAELSEAARSVPQVIILDAAHAEEHGLEVHLPFLQQVFGRFSILPLVVGDATPEEVCALLEKVWGGPETLFVVSSDLSHYQDYESAKRMDATTSRAIEALRSQDIGADQACGRVPIQGLLLCAKTHGLKASTIDLRSSGDTSGPRDQVVGYGAYVFV
jgi:AmmeMemoRadiSam system protein B